MIQIIGDGFAAASYATVPFGYAAQDITYTLKGLAPHPKNYDVSFAKQLSDILHDSIKIDAYDYITHDDIFETPIVGSKLVIVWPNFYRGRLLFNDQLVHYNFSDVRKDIDPNLKAQIYEVMNEFDFTTAQSLFNSKLLDFTTELASRNIKYVMTMSNGSLSTGTGNWLWDPKITNIKSWAEENGYLNDFEYLNAAGHKKLSELLAINLTNQ